MAEAEECRSEESFVVLKPFEEDNSDDDAEAEEEDEEEREKETTFEKLLVEQLSGELDSLTREHATVNKELEALRTRAGDFASENFLLKKQNDTLQSVDKENAAEILTLRRAIDAQRGKELETDVLVSELKERNAELRERASKAEEAADAQHKKILNLGEEVNVAEAELDCLHGRLLAAEEAKKGHEAELAALKEENETIRKEMSMTEAALGHAKQLLDLESSELAFENSRLEQTIETMRGRILTLEEELSECVIMHETSAEIRRLEETIDALAAEKAAAVRELSKEKEEREKTVNELLCLIEGQQDTIYNLEASLSAAGCSGDF